MYLWLRRGGGEGGIVHVQNVQKVDWLRQVPFLVTAELWIHSIVFVVVVVVFFIYNFVVIFGIWVFGTRSSLPRTGCYSLKKRPLKVLRYRKIFGFVHLISSFLKYVTVVVTQKFHLRQVILDKSTISVIPIIQGCCHLLLMPNDGKFAGN